MMNNIEKKRFLRNFIFSLYFWKSLGFEPTYLPNLNQNTNHLKIAVPILPIKI